jgi:hypothetical protein
MYAFVCSVNCTSLLPSESALLIHLPSDQNEFPKCAVLLIGKSWGVAEKSPYLSLLTVCICYVLEA